jgi:hypothetical protein
VEAIVALRGQLSAEGHDCGAATIAYHLAEQMGQVPSVSTIWRILKREGLVSPQPQKRPRSSLIRFAAELPNEMWQADITHWALAGKEHAEILNMIDDHSRLFLASRAFPAQTLAGLQEQLEAFARYYNTTRPHRALGGRTPLQAYGARVKARPPGSPSVDAHFRVRQDKVDPSGTVTLRHGSRLHHIGIGRAHKGQTVKLLIADRDIRVLDLGTGELIRQLTLDPSRDYQPIGGG